MQLNATEQKWFDQIQEARSSGLSDRAWCLQNNIPSSTFYYHIHKLRDKVADFPAARSHAAPEIHEVVKLELLDDDPLTNYPSYKNDPIITHNTPNLGPCDRTPLDPGFSARLRIDSFTVDFSNSANDQVIRALIKALRQPC